MNYTWKTFGHASVKRILDKQLESSRFAHAYLFTGPEGVGKKTLALEFARRILRAERLDSHPDFQILDEAEQISVERAREFITSLNFKPFVGSKKVAIVNDAQNLNTQSSNALLKTLEEPSESTILILVASGKALLPTILSRCQIFNFNAFTKDLLQDFASAEHLKISDKDLEYSFGSPARLKLLAGDNELRTRETSKVNQFKELREGTLADRLLAIGQLAELENPELEQVILAWLNFQTQKLADYPQSFRLVEALADALNELKTNKNKKLVLQGLMMKM